jgi:hypothetical protein
MKGNTRKGWFAVLSLSLLLGACERELPDNKLPDKDIQVRVRLVGVAEGGEEDIVRSASTSEQEEVVTPVGDGVLMEMRMERETSELRAIYTLAGNAYFRVVAVEHGTSTFISYGDFTINTGSVAVAGGLHVPDNGTYDFICYSYNNNTALAALNYAQGSTISGSEVIDVYSGTSDLLWEKIENITVSGVAPELDILLNRVMAKVKVLIDCRYNSWTITGISGSVTLGSIYTGGTIRLTDGGVASNTGTPTFTSWSGSGYQRESNELLVMPKGSGSSVTVSVPANAVARSGLSAIPAAARNAAFTVELKSRYSYRLCVRLKTPKWAGSNIYWNGSALTFDLHGTTTNEGYQGVFFKWGSLVGISPAGSFSSSTVLYKPSAIATGDFANWDAIPYWEDYSIVGDPNLGTFKGDICRQINSGYRLPNVQDYGNIPTFLTWGEQGWSLINGASTITPSDEGKYNFISNSKRYAQNTIMGVRLPAAGNRGTSGALGSAGSYGYYWSRNVHDSSASGSILFNATQMSAGGAERKMAFPVRCVVAPTL